MNRFHVVVCNPQGEIVAVTSPTDPITALSSSRLMNAAAGRSVSTVKVTSLALRTLQSVLLNKAVEVSPGHFLLTDASPGFGPSEIIQPENRENSSAVLDALDEAIQAAEGSRSELDGPAPPPSDGSSQA